MTIALYGADTRTILKGGKKRVEAFETQCWRRSLKIPWTEKIKNEKLLRNKRTENNMGNISGKGENNESDI